MPVPLDGAHDRWTFCELSLLIDFAHMVLSMIIDSVLAVAIVYFLWRIKGQYEKRIKELEAEVRLLMSRRSED